MMDCPEPSALQDLLGGAITGARADGLWRHIDGCTDCVKLLAAVGGVDEAQARTMAETHSSEGGRTSKPEQPSLEEGQPIIRGTRIGRYEVEHLLGRGAFGAVYAGKDPELGRPIALKLLQTLPTDGDAMAESRFLREAQSLARVSHPNVVAIFDSGVWQGRVFIAMERVDGTNLAAWLDERPRSIAEIVDVFLAAGRGLGAAHAVGLVHRDFKPANVLVSNDGKVKVSDFGLARPMGPGFVAPEPASQGGPGSSDSSAPLTQAGAVLGTPPYMAPEQHLGTDVDARTDQFAFCASLYEALYGRRPFGGSYAQLRDDILHGRVRPPPPTARVPATLHQIVLRGLAVLPGERWPTLEALLQALGRDRTRLPRRIAAVAAAVLGVLLTALTGDWVLRDRLYAVAKESFAAARARVDHTVASRYEAFQALAELSTLVPAVRQVAAARDQADFGFGSGGDDRARFENLHASLRDADWKAWAPALKRGQIAIADYKGRLCFATAAPEVWGLDVRGVRGIASAYDPAGTGSSAQVLPADDPALLESRMSARRDGLELVFAHAAMLAGVPQATFIQLLDGDRLLQELSTDKATTLVLVAPGGATEGSLPRDVLSAARESNTLREVTTGGASWLVQGSALPGLRSQDESIATLVIARPVDVGLAGLFPHARTFLLLLSAAALGVLAWAFFTVRANARTLSRAVGVTARR
jgi:hypothetical protein